MEDTKTSQSQQFTAPWKALVENQLAQVEAMFSQVGKVEDAGVAQMQSAAAESARLMTGSLAYGVRLSSESRRLFLEAGRQMAELFTPRF